ncbi:pseudouridine synthase [Desulfolutivibrio sulfoxidireducens]|uniref:pseudouridine synthase n=1 Tax=Desulfolutivibrio sulfoxidireducens TaxID=2773299 RepID=UPI0034A39D51
MISDPKDVPGASVDVPVQALRLNKALSQAGVCSRRRADELVLAGKVAVNGVVIHEPGLKIDPNRDNVVVDGQKVDFLPLKEHLYLLFHKPVQTVTTASDPQGRTTVFDLLPPTVRRAGLFTVGRLDYFSEGLLVFTDDGELVHRLTHPSTHVPKIYRVLVRGEVTEGMLATMRGGMRLAEGEILAPVTVSVLEHDPDHAPGSRTLLEMRLIQGVNRQIRRMCRDLGLTVLRLVRTQQGPIHLGDLPRGQTRPLTPAEVASLRDAAGLASPGVSPGFGVPPARSGPEPRQAPPSPRNGPSDKPSTDRYVKRKMKRHRNV